MMKAMMSQMFEDITVLGQFCANVITQCLLLMHKMDLWSYKEHINASNSIGREHCSNIFFGDFWGHFWCCGNYCWLAI